MAGLNLAMKKTYALVPSTTITTSTVSAGNPLYNAQQNPNHSCARISISITALTGTSITYTVTGIDPISGSSTGTIIASAAQSGTGVIDLIVAPITAVSNRAVNAIMPYRWKLTTTGTITSVTHSIFVELFNL